MMEELCYSALDLAIIIGGMDLGCRAKASLLENIWEMERPFLEEIYRKNKRQLMLNFQSSKRMLWLWERNFLLMLTWEASQISIFTSKMPDCGYSMAAAMTM